MEDTIEYKGRRITIERDAEPFDPREDDNMGTMVCFHKRYVLGDRNHGISEDHYYSDKIGDTIYINNWDDVKKQIKELKGEIAVILPLFLYDHSGITMYTSGNTDYRQHESWDSGQVGFIFITKKKVREEYQVKRISNKLLEKVKKALIQEVETYDDYLTGNVYGFTTDNDSCWGFFGDSGYKEAIEEAKNSIDCQIEKEQKEHEDKLKRYIKNNVPLQYRFIN